MKKYVEHPPRRLLNYAFHLNESPIDVYTAVHRPDTSKEATLPCQRR